MIKLPLEPAYRYLPVLRRRPRGGINAVAGGGSFVSFPALLFVGVSPIPANATNTLALWVGTTASGGAYPQKLNIPRRVMIPLVLTSIAGGLAGAFLLIKTPRKLFCTCCPGSCSAPRCSLPSAST